MSSALIQTARETRPAWRQSTTKFAAESVAGVNYELYMGDLHRHTDLSLCRVYYDGTLEDAYRYAIEAGELPGAVVVVARHGRIAYFMAFGNRSIQPKTESMTVDTIFDMSSLTKVMATTPSIMLLVEKGAITKGKDSNEATVLARAAGSGDVVILKTIAPPSIEEFDEIIQEARRQARAAGLKKSDIETAIKAQRAAR